MAIEIPLYGNIDSESAEEFIEEMNEAIGEDISIRVNTDGGDPQYGFGIIAKILEHPKATKIKIDGKAYSTGSFLCAYCPDVEALDVSQFWIHRAAYPEYFESMPEFMTHARTEDLANVNANLRAALEAKIDVPAFEKITKVTMDEIFSMESRIDVPLTAKQALKIGLINSVVKITPKKKAEIEAFQKVKMAASHKEETQQQPIKKIMTLAELKASNPEVYAQAQAEGIALERDRVGSWLPFIGADAEMVTASIKDGKHISATAMSELNVKMFASNSLAAIAGGNAKPVVTPELELAQKAGEKDAAEKEANIISFRNEARAGLGLPLLK